MRPDISIRLEKLGVHQKTHHVLAVSDLLALSRQCASILVTDAF